MLWEVLADMFENDRSAARDMMASRGHYLVEHETKMGNAHAQSLFARIEGAPEDSAKPTERKWPRTRPFA